MKGNAKFLPSLCKTTLGVLVFVTLLAGCQGNRSRNQGTTLRQRQATGAPQSNNQPQNTIQAPQSTEEKKNDTAEQKESKTNNTPEVTQDTSDQIKSKEINNSEVTEAKTANKPSDNTASEQRISTESVNTSRATENKQLKTEARATSEIASNNSKVTDSVNQSEKRDNQPVAGFNQNSIVTSTENRQSELDGLTQSMATLNQLELIDGQYATTGLSHVRQTILAKLRALPVDSRSASSKLAQNLDLFGVSIAQPGVVVEGRVNGAEFRLEGQLLKKKAAVLRDKNRSDMAAYFHCLDNNPQTCFTQLIELRDLSTQGVAFAMIQRRAATVEFKKESLKSSALKQLSDLLWNTEINKNSPNTLYRTLVETIEVINGPSMLRVLLAARNGNYYQWQAPLYVTSKDNSGLSLTEMETVEYTPMSLALSQEFNQLNFLDNLQAYLVKFSSEGVVDIQISEKDMTIESQKVAEKINLRLILQNFKIRNVK